MRSLLILSIGISTALALHFTPQGRHFTQTVITGLNQAQSTINAINMSGVNSTTAAQAPGAFKSCPHFFYQGTPPSVPNAEQWKPRALCFDAFAVYHSGKSKTPIFVAEKLNRAQLVDAQDEKRTNRFYADARLPSAERATLDDYKGSGYDRGHMAPAGDMPTPAAMAQSFSLANMVPQAPDNNRGIWAKSVEKAVRKYVMRAQGDVYVITGPSYSHGKSADSSMTTVWVPSALFKLVYDPTANKAWAYWVDNHDDAKMNGTISYSELVKRTGIQFLSNH